MLARMDIISVSCPHTPATYHLLSARRLKLIRKDAYIVNTARGGVIDEDTLIKLIESGDVAGAGLDVYEHEPRQSKLVRLAKAGKVTLLPHMGSATIEGRVEMGEGDHQHQNLPRQPQAAGSRAAQHAVTGLGCSSNVCAEIRNRRRIPVQRVRGIAGIAQGLEPHRAGVHHQEPTDRAHRTRRSRGSLQAPSSIPECRRARPSRRLQRRRHRARRRRFGKSGDRSD
jgi:hypothetical protein